MKAIAEYEIGPCKTPLKNNADITCTVETENKKR